MIVEATVHIRNGFFVLEIVHVSYSSQNEIRPNLFAAVNSESVVYNHLYFRIVLKNGVKPILTLLRAEHGFLVRVDTDADIKFIKQWQRTVHNIYMTQRNWIERSGKKTNAVQYEKFKMEARCKAKQKEQPKGAR